MTNKELIETANQAMKDLWEFNQGRLLKHEQTAYDCLKLFCERLPDDEDRALMHAGLPDECIKGWEEVKFCENRQGEGNQCKQCSHYL